MLLGFSLIFAMILLVSIARPSLNPGIPALLIALFAAPFADGSKIHSAASLFPTSLFLTLLGVTFFFSSLNSTGLIDLLLQRILLAIRPFPRLIPALLFLLTAVLTASGLGNIATIALIAPIAIPLSHNLKISPFLMTLLLVGAANAASFSPLTLPGIFTNEFIQNSETLKKSMSPATMRWIIFWLVFACITVTTILSYTLIRRTSKAKTHPKSAEISIDSDYPPPLLNPAQRKTASLALLVAFIFVLASVLSLKIWQGSLPETLLRAALRLGDVGLMGWIGSFLLVVFGLSSPERDLKNVPWSTILMVCGMSTYIELLSRLGLPDAIAQTVQQHLPVKLLPSAFAAAAALLSAFSSSVGVALPVFMPIVQSVSKSLDSALAQTLTVTVAVGSHLVDASPLSTLGALCLAQIRTPAEQSSSYRSLLIYSFLMIPVAALWAFALMFIFI